MIRYFCPVFCRPYSAIDSAESAWARETSALYSLAKVVVISAATRCWSTVYRRRKCRAREAEPDARFYLGPKGGVCEDVAHVIKDDEGCRAGFKSVGTTTNGEWRGKHNGPGGCGLQ